MGLFAFPFQSVKGQNVTYYPGAKLYFYDAGTTNPKTVYTTSAKTTPHSNPVIADGDGRFSPIWADGEFDAVLKDNRDVQIWEAEGVQDVLFGSLNYQNDFNSSTNGGDYPSGGARGDLHRCVEQFTLNAASGSHVLNIGDFILCNKDGATAIDADWDIFRGKTVASEALAGIVELATQAEAEAGTDDQRAMTPLKTKQAIQKIIGAGVSLTTGQSITGPTTDKILYDTEDYDPNGWFDGVTNYRFQPNIAGWYTVLAVGRINIASGFVAYFRLHKNGSLHSVFGTAFPNGTSDPGFSGATLVYLNGSTDYLEMFMQTTDTATRTIAGGGSNNSVHFILRGNP